MLWLLALWLSLTIGNPQDPYYQMESHNLNTMNSYFIPQTTLPTNASWQVDLANYATVSQDLHNAEAVLGSADAAINGASVIHLMSSYFGVWLQLLFFGFIWYMLKYKPNSGFSQTMTLAYEGIFDFFEGILGEKTPLWMKQFSVSLFFIILIANSFAWLSDIVRFFFPFRLRNVTAGTAELEFNVALAIVGSIAILAVQRKAVGGTRKLLHEYVPITWKWLLPSKAGDILISLFMGVLDIVWFIARIISLSLRLFWNMSAGSILLNVAFLWLGAATVGVFGFNLPLWIPLIVYLQWVLSVLIQAFVFTLIIAIGMKMAHE